MMKLWVDDERPEPEGWMRAKTSDEAINYLKSNMFSEVSLDHDLGMCKTCEKVDDYTCQHNGNGYLVVCWIEEESITNPIYSIPIVHVHTANPSAKIRMDFAANRIAQMRLQK